MRGIRRIVNSIKFKNVKTNVKTDETTIKNGKKESSYKEQLIKLSEDIMLYINLFSK